MHYRDWFSIECLKTKVITLPITMGANNVIIQSELEIFKFNQLQAREDARVHVAAGFGFCFSLVEKVARDICANH